MVLYQYNMLMDLFDPTLHSSVRTFTIFVAIKVIRTYNQTVTAAITLYKTKKKNLKNYEIHGEPLV